MLESKVNLLSEIDAPLGKSLLDVHHGCFINQGLIVGMVGLPGRGKLCVGKKCVRYLNWIGITSTLYDIYNESLEKKMSVTSPQKVHKTLLDACNWLEVKGKIAFVIFNFNTIQDRQRVSDFVRRKGLNLMFVEFIITNEKLLRYIVHKYQTDKTEEEVMKTIKDYSLPYETIDEKVELYPHVKVYNSGESIIVQNCCNYLQTKIIQFLYHLNIQTERVVYLTRNAESENNARGIIGGNSNLSPKGIAYATALAKYISVNCGDDISLWTSNMDAALETSEILGIECENYLALDNPLTGVCNGLTKQEVEEKFPEEFARHKEDRFNHWFPFGESYHDVKIRLTPIILQLETEYKTVIVSHKAVIQCILGYFLDKSEKEIVNISVPRHNLCIVKSDGYRYKLEYEKILDD